MIRRVLTYRQYRLSEAIKPEWKSVTREFWQHTLKAIKDVVLSDTAIRPRIYSEDMIKGVSVQGGRSQL